MYRYRPPVELVKLEQLEQLGADVTRGRTIARWVLGGILVVAGLTHVTIQRTDFQAQVPSWFPLNADIVVLVSGVVELTLGAALIALRRHRVLVGVIVAVFFVAIFPGNIAQWTDGTDAFGLDTDTKRFVRLLFQPILVIWAAWATGASGLLRQQSWS